MRLLQLATAPDELLELHPIVSVVSGLDAARRAALLAAVAALPRADAPVGPGLLEAHGVLLDLSGEVLRLLALGDGDLDPIVRAGDLPGAPSARAVVEPAEDAAAGAQRVAARAAAVDERVERAVAGPQVVLEQLEARVQELEAEGAALVPADAAAVRAALERWQGAASADQVPSPDAMALADELDALDEELEAVPGGAPGDAGASNLTEVRVRLDAARQALLEAEGARRSPQLDPADVAALEDAHAALRDAVDRADRRLGGARARRRVEELRGVEQEVLDRLGFTSYPDYVMGSAGRPVDPGAEAAVEAAREALAATEAEWEGAQADAERTLARAALLDRRRELVERAASLLGRPTDATAAAAELRTLRVPATPAAVLLADLQRCLDDAGLAVGDEDLEAEELEAIASAWLAEEGQLAQRRLELDAELQRAEEDRAAARAALHDRELEAAPPTPAVIELPAAAEPGGPVDLGEPVDAAGPVAPVEPVDPEAVEWYLLARLAALRSVSYAGSVPILLDDTLRGLDEAVVGQVLDRLEPMAEAVQMIIVSDDPVVHAWAETAGPDRAAVVSPLPV